MRKIFILLFLLPSTILFGQDTLSVEKDKSIDLNSSSSKKRKVRAEKTVSILEEIDVNSSFSVVIEDARIITIESNQNRSRRSSNQHEENQINNAVELMREMDDNSFEYNYFKYISGNYDVSLFPFLKKANRLKPQSSDVQTQMAAYYLIKENDEQADIFINSLFENHTISTALIDYGQDLLASIPKNGTLITHGVEDTYAVVFLQLSMGLRSDVEVVSLELLQSEMYRDHLKVKGYILPLSDFVDVNYYAEFCSLNEEKNISTSLTVPREYLQTLPQKQFITGLVMRYSSKPVDNVNLNINLWKYELRYLILENSNDVKSKELSSNYLPMLFQLRHVFNLMEEEQEVVEIDHLLDVIGLFSGKEEKVQSLKAKY